MSNDNLFPCFQHTVKFKLVLEIMFHFIMKTRHFLRSPYFFQPSLRYVDIVLHSQEVLTLQVTAIF